MSRSNVDLLSCWPNDLKYEELLDDIFQNKVVSGDFGRALPLVVFGAASIVAGVAALMLPETLNKQLPETIKDAEIFGKYVYNILNAIERSPTHRLFFGWDLGSHIENKWCSLSIMFFKHSEPMWIHLSDGYPHKMCKKWLGHCTCEFIQNIHLLPV